MTKYQKKIYNHKEIKSQFPIFNNRDLVYLDSAASSQKPLSVLKSINEVYTNHYANIHRGVYKLSQVATDMHEDAREIVKNFINANSVREIIFVRGATEAINLVTSTVAEINIKEGDEIILSRLEHHSNIVPWQILAKKHNAVIKIAEADENGDVTFESVFKNVTSRTKFISITHVSNAIGSIIPVKDQNNLPILEVDEYMRPDTTMQSLGALEPSFAQMGNQGFNDVAILKYPEIEAIKHVHHAGNSSGIVDGAAGVLLGNKRMADKYELKARAKIRSFASIGSEPTIMLTGPADSAEKALKKANMKASDIDLFEMNEAFAAVVLRFMEALNIDHSKVNVNGGAIALGHPLGATGAIILGTVLDELERRDLSTGLITLCVGAGMGTATIIERI